MTDWSTPIGILLSGLIVGFMFVYTMKRKSPSGAKSLELADLEAKRDAVIRQLRELNDAGGPAEERSRLEREAADVLRALDGVKGSESSAPSASDSVRSSGMNPTIKGFIWGVLSTSAVVALGYFVMQSSTPRGEGQGVTGGQPMQQAPSSSSSAAPAQNDAELQQLEAKVKASPNDVGLRDDLARAYLDRENLMAVFEHTEAALKLAPNDARALAYQGLVRMAMGQTAAAETMLKKACAADPGMLDAWVSLAWLYVQNGRQKEAGAVIQEAIRHHPEEQARLGKVLDEMRTRLANAPTQGGGAPAATAEAAPSGAPSAGGPAVQITLQLAPGTKPSPTSVLFVYARENGVTSGPPAAVKRLPVSSFPVTLELSAADSMMGQPLPASMRIEARLDSDGNAMTKDASDPTAAQEKVTAGSSVTLTLGAH